jgi:hypothetical protein
MFAGSISTQELRVDGVLESDDHQGARTSVSAKSAGLLTSNIGASRLAMDDHH